MKLIAVTGKIASGKDEVARYISRVYGYTLLDHSEILGEILQRAGRPTTREEKRALRLEKGNMFTAEAIIQEILTRGLTKVVIGSLRRPEEYQLTKKAFPDLKLVVVEADEHIRFQRLQARGRDVPHHYEAFLDGEATEEKVYHFKKTFAYADVVLLNNGSLQELHAQIDRLMHRWE